MALAPTDPRYYWPLILWAGIWILLGYFFINHNSVYSEWAYYLCNDRLIVNLGKIHNRYHTKKDLAKLRLVYWGSLMLFFIPNYWGRLKYF